ncbi:right-handed parallel beta-helix repeat-containing protein [Nonomuraea sp. NPDC059194]|uniref:right-handed parallel beta-helix repeat-containing protein n=1 Tax=Nonomuraea sp. NPDC059194 TaxID=3346764 RepID=UPI003685C03C
MAAGLVAGAQGTAHAATIFVPCFGPNGGGAGLVNAINTANLNAGADTIVLSPLCPYTLNNVNNNTNGPNGLPAVSTEITITGNGATIQRNPVGTRPNFRVFLVSSGGDLTLTGVTVRNGRTAFGAGIRVDGGAALTLNNSVIRNNTANDPTPGGLAFGGGIFNNTGSVTIRNSTIRDNTAVAEIAAGAGIASGAGSLTLIDSTVRGNAATGGDAAQGGGVWSIFGNTLNITRGIVTGNTVDAPDVAGAGIVAAAGGTAQINGAVVRGNVATASGATGQAQGGGIFNGDPMTLRNSVVTVNVARATGGGTATGGGVLNEGALTRQFTAIVANVPDNCVNSGSGTGC